MEMVIEARRVNISRGTGDKGMVSDVQREWALEHSRMCRIEHRVHAPVKDNEQDRDTLPREESDTQLLRLDDDIRACGGCTDRRGRCGGDRFDGDLNIRRRLGVDYHGRSDDLVRWERNDLGDGRIDGSPDLVGAGTIDDLRAEDHIFSELGRG